MSCGSGSVIQHIEPFFSVSSSIARSLRNEEMMFVVGSVRDLEFIHFHVKSGILLFDIRSSRLFGLIAR
jgi:hypothetical protein